ncbi:MAG: YchF/TatD family DNA exonuclease [Candidatus Latescibacteria bacterium]|nr:YchF/TatD family DNA exonuclease [bacterium]MBD3422922.1 YchF/TatD family DNA exonuclease [Candidatus Latescibacterota bacterium]
MGRIPPGMLVDTHVHLNMPHFDDDRREAVRRADQAGVGEMVAIGYDRDSIDQVTALTAEYGGIYAAVGIHPHEAADFDEELEERVKKNLLKKKVLAVGEIGLDYYRDLSPRDKQQEVLRKQIAAAQYFEKPLVIHCRDAFDDVIRILDEEGAAEVGGIFHAFGGGIDEAREIYGLGFVVGIGGPVTYRNSRLPETLAALPSSGFVLETDCPYLPPVPYRGKRNEPSYLPLIAEKCAEVKGVFPRDIARATGRNYRRQLHGEKEIPPSLVYSIRDSLYINTTGVCTNDCEFCARSKKNNELYGYNLDLITDPDTEEIAGELEDYISEDDYGEIVFCGYGEPTTRLDFVLKTARELKKHNLPLRLNTNGQGNMINRRDIVGQLEELFDRVSISLNAPDRESYTRICRPDAGGEAFDSVVDFLKKSARSRMECTATAVELPGVDIEGCRSLVQEIPGADFRVRTYHLDPPA